MNAHKKKGQGKWSQKELKEILEVIRGNRVSKLRSFLELGWNPKNGIQGRNPLNFTKDLRFAGMLIEAGADVNKAYQYTPPLLFHCSCGNLGMVKLLLEKGADVNIQVSKNAKRLELTEGYSPLMCSTEPKDADIFYQLLDWGADINLKDKLGRTALSWAFRRNKKELAEELLKKGAVLDEDILEWPVCWGDLPMIRKLIKMGANVNAKAYFALFDNDRKGASPWTMLAKAISKIGTQGYPDKVVESLVNAGADVNCPVSSTAAVFKGGKSTQVPVLLPPARIAGSRGLRPVIDLLMKAGAKTTLAEAMADWTLELAIAYRIPFDEVEIVKLLIKAGSNVNEVGILTGKTPLTLAREGGKDEIAKLLKKAGAHD